MRLLVIHTGGTIGMTQTDQGFAPLEGIVEAEIQDLLDTNEVSASVGMLALDPLIDSAEATPADWHRIAKIISDSKNSYDGFVVTHGTDTLPYTAGALCLALPGLQSPVIVTGAMLPLTVEGSDGRRNLRDALNAATQKMTGVWVQFAGQLLHGARVRKTHSKSLEAFKAEASSGAPLLSSKFPQLGLTLNHKVGIFSIVPGPCIEILSFAVDNCDGLVMRCYGSGTAPDTAAIRAALERARDREVPIIATSQCPEGGMHFGTYAAGKVLRDSGVIDGRDITPEMAYVKLHYSLSLCSDYAERCQFLATNQCGELTVHSN